MPAWVIPAISAAAGLIGQGIAAGKDKRQLKQQGKLNDQQIEANDRMLGIQNKHALQMWKDTNYDAQKGEMMKADLNPALMYGMGGGGGTTTSTPSANVSATKATGRTGRESEDAIAMGMQLQLLKAQKDNIEADTRVKVAEADLKPIQSDNIKAQTGNVIVDTELKRVNTTIAGLESKYLNESMGDRLQKLSGEAVQAIQAGQQAVNNTSISDNTRLDTIKRLKAEAVGAILKNALTGAQTANTQAGTVNTKADTRLKGQAYEQNIQKLMIEWRELSVKEREHELRRMLGIGQDDAVNQTMRMITEALDDIIMFRTGTATKPGHTPIKGFGGK